MQQTSLTVIAKRLGREYDIPAAIVLGVIQVESAGNEWATRFERHYRWCWDVRAGKPFTASAAAARRTDAPDGFHGTNDAHGGYYSSADTEWNQQKTSWGPMQIMGAVAREHGYDGPLPRLCDPLIGIDYGCRHLARLRDRFIDRHGWAGVLDAYNDGTARIERPHDYPHKVAATSPGAEAEIFPKARGAS
ncbi:transglycosylase SLT domain-containing protein [Salinisphaera orenii]|uniref:Transglycosylase n=1 Tax=Salinisphaera orenii YIM 95161 TaxID=1051139 RepID=A0A423PRM8_9GAMM|nr:transglycosylase SLT domain-containing protein [Salinisphaera halophila]ROO28233.1 transglycosylase [Salinisphaera halophila YIM 95161]